MKLTLKSLLDELDSIPLTLEQFKILSNVKSFLSYEDLLKYNSFEQIFDTLGDKILIIIKSSSSFGHYAVLFKQNKNNCCFYDSYGLSNKEIVRLFPYTNRFLQGIDPIEKLKSSSKIKLDRNVYKHQDKDTLTDKIQTCGFHSSTRLRYSFLSNSDYDIFLKSTKLAPDDFVILSNLNNAIDIL